MGLGWVGVRVRVRVRVRFRVRARVRVRVRVRVGRARDAAGVARVALAVLRVLAIGTVAVGGQLR